MRTILLAIIRLKNPLFNFDEAVSSNTLFWLLWDKFWALSRGCGYLLLSFRLPKLFFVERYAKIYELNKIQLGQFVQIGAYAEINALSKNGIILGNNSKIGAFSKVIASGSLSDIGKGIRIGHNVGIGEYAYLGGAGGLEIDDDCIIGQYLSCHPENHIYHDTTTLIRLQGVERKGIYIGKNCWIGAKVTITDGVNIGNNCVIAAGAVVTKSFAANSVIGGVPAKLLKTIA